VSLIRSAWAADFAPRDRRPIYDWAREFISLRPPFTRTGPFDVQESRHFIGPFDALFDPVVREVNVCSPVRDGKTLIADIWLPWTVCNAPGSFLGIFMKDEVAQQHCETRTWRILESIAQIKALLDALDRHDARTQEILFEDPIYIWGPSTKNLQSKPITYLWFDEAWQFHKGVIREGKGRLGDALKLGLDKTLVTSQGGQKQTTAADRTDDWWLQFDAGELNVWNAPCRGCGKLHVPLIHAAPPEQQLNKSHRVGLTWDDHRDDRGLWIIPRCLETLRYVCPLCAHVTPLSDQARTRHAWNLGGKHVVIGEAKRVKKSFTNTGLINYPWEFLAEEFMTVKNHVLLGERGPWIQFLQKYLAQFHDLQEEEEYELLPTIEINIPSAPTVPSARAEAPPPIHWTDELTGEKITFTHRHLMIDVSLRRLWAVASAWSDQGDDLTLEAREIPVDAQGAFNYAAVETMQRQWMVSDQDVGWDVNYEERAQEVMEEIVKHGHLETEGDETRWRQWVGYRGDRRASFRYIIAKKIRLTPVVMTADKRVCPDLEVIDPAPGIRNPDDAPEFFLPLGEGLFRKKECIVFRWSKPAITAILEARTHRPPPLQDHGALRRRPSRFRRLQKDGYRPRHPPRLPRAGGTGGSGFDSPACLSRAPL
jgi:hypothetical protein